MTIWLDYGTKISSGLGNTMKDLTDVVKRYTVDLPAWQFLTVKKLLRRPLAPSNIAPCKHNVLDDVVVYLSH
jgi:hypothetical protein